MSRSYKNNYKLGHCCKGNIKYYKIRRKLRRHRLNHELRNIMANYTLEDVDEMIVGDVMPKENQNDEPSDGHAKLWKSEYAANKAEYDSCWGKKIGYVLKQKKRRNRTS